MAKNKNAEGISICLDELEEAQDQLSRRPSDDARKALNKWIREQKTQLKGMGYKGKMPRKHRSKT